MQHPVNIAKHFSVILLIATSQTAGPVYRDSLTRVLLLAIFASSGVRKADMFIAQYAVLFRQISVHQLIIIIIIMFVA